jgi:hypothetical protein
VRVKAARTGAVTAAIAGSQFAARGRHRAAGRAAAGTAQWRAHAGLLWVDDTAGMGRASILN